MPTLSGCAFPMKHLPWNATPLSPSGVRKDFQRALAEMRTDLDVFTPDESQWLDGLWLSDGVERPRPRSAQAPEGVAERAPRRLAVPEMLAEITTCGQQPYVVMIDWLHCGPAHNVDFSTGSLSPLVRTPPPLWGKVKSFLEYCDAICQLTSTKCPSRVRKPHRRLDEVWQRRA